MINSKIDKYSLSSFRITETELQDFNTDINKINRNDHDNYNFKLLKDFESTNDIEPLKKRVRSIIGGAGRLNWCNTNVYCSEHRLLKKWPYRYDSDFNL